MKYKKLMLLFGGFGAFAVLLVVGVNFALKLVPVPTSRTVLPQALPPPGNEESEIAPVEKGGGVFHIQAGTRDHRPIRYTKEGFSPRAITIQASDDLGCLITVLNGADTPLRVGVSPHDTAGDPGANYGEIQPGKAGVLDTRYSGLTEVVLHNHLNPAHEIEVAYGSGCL